MQSFAFLQDLAIVLTVALAMGFLFHRLKQPALIGYIVGGLLVGPYTAGYTAGPHRIEALAEIGVVLLMFALGVEFSFRELRAVWKVALLGGCLQIALVAGTTTLAATLLGLPLAVGILLGCVFALSSTVVVLKILMERGELDSTHGQVILGFLIVQDLSLVPMMIFLPSLASPHDALGWPLLIAIGKAGVFLAAMVVFGTKLLPAFMRKVAETGSKELFLLTIFAICFGTAAATAWLGMSLAVGAFIAGIVVSESDHSHQVLAEMLPLRDLFATLFFVSVGMLINPQFLWDNWNTILVIGGAVMAFKALIVFGLVQAFGYTGRTALAAGLGLAQFSEFAFVLAVLGRDQGILDEHLFAVTLAIALVSMLFTPLLMAAAMPLYQFAGRFTWIQKAQGRDAKKKLKGTAPLPFADHVVLCGYGRVGRRLGEVFQALGQPFLVVEIDQNIVMELRQQGIQVLYGEASREEVLKHALLPVARLLVIATPDPLASEMILRHAKRLNPELSVLARANRMRDLDVFYELGASEVVQPEFEASLELIRYSLNLLGYPPKEIYTYTDRVRRERYRQFQSTPLSLAGLEAELGGIKMQWIHLPPEAPILGLSLLDSQIRQKTGTVVLAIRRAGDTLPNPSPLETVHAHDALLVMGNDQQITSLREWVAPGGG